MNTVPPCASTSDVPVAEAWSSLPGASRDPRGAAACQHKRTADGASVSQHRRHERGLPLRAVQFAQDSLHRNAAVREVSSEGLRIRRAAVDARERPSRPHARGRSCTREVAAARTSTRTCAYYSVHTSAPAAMSTLSTTRRSCNKRNDLSLQACCAQPYKARVIYYNSRIIFRVPALRTW